MCVMTSRQRRVIRSPFASALAGGAVVAVFGWIAIAAGWIQSEGGTTTTVAAPMTAPIVEQAGDDGDTNVVNEIYKADGDGVAFIEAESPPEEATVPLALRRTRIRIRRRRHRDRLRLRDRRPKATS